MDFYWSNESKDGGLCFGFSCHFGDVLFKTALLELLIAYRACDMMFLVFWYCFSFQLVGTSFCMLLFLFWYEYNIGVPDEVLGFC